jgi:hypothetical protein
MTATFMFFIPDLFSLRETELVQWLFLIPC